MKCIEKNFKYYFIKPIVEGLICTIAVCAGYGQLFPVMKIIAIFLSSLGILFPISFVEFHLKTRRSEWDHPLLFWYCIEKSFKFDSEWLVQGNSLHQASCWPTGIADASGSAATPGRRTATAGWFGVRVLCTSFCKFFDAKIRLFCKPHKHFNNLFY